MGRLSAYLESKPRNAARIILTLVVALIVVLAALTVLLVQSSGIMDPPYPSDDTPLRLAATGVEWKMEFNQLDWDGNGIRYVNMSLGLAVNFGSGPSKWSTRLANDSVQDMLSDHVPASVTTPWFDFSNFWMNVTVTDTEGDGTFGVNDSISIGISPFIEHTVYTMAWAWMMNGGGMYTEFSFAIHDGKLYSWYSHEFSTERGPWYGTGMSLTS